MMTMCNLPGYSWFAINSLGFASLNDKNLAAMLEENKFKILEVTIARKMLP